MKYCDRRGLQGEVAMVRISNRRAALALGAGVVLAAAVGVAGRQSDAALVAKVDQVFARWNTNTTPGCAVGVSVGGKSVLERAYGVADLEHDVKNTANTIFEAGSVSKQFTAAAVLLLARDGKLSLDDPVRKYIPELPDYGAPLTIRHMLNHTSGLRDWGSVAAIAGGAPAPVPYDQDSRTGDFRPRTGDACWENHSRRLGASCARG